MEQKILTLLGLKNTFVGTPDDDRIIEGTRLGYRHVFEFPMTIKEASIPAGYFYSDAADMGRWISMAASYAVKYFAITGIVILYGFIVGWFYSSTFCKAFIYVGVVLVLAYFIDSFKVKKDIAYINTKIAENKKV